MLERYYQLTFCNRDDALKAFITRGDQGNEIMHHVAGALSWLGSFTKASTFFVGQDKRC